VREDPPHTGLPSTFDDPEVWSMIASGHARGVHHIESPAMTSLNRMVHVGRIDDLIAIVSVIRPGAANSMRKEVFARRAQGLEPVAYAHPSLEPVLRSTYGVMAYEEHVLQICETFAGMSAGHADLLRRALVKNKAEKAAAFLGDFAACAREAGRSEEDIARVWELLMGFRCYAFCRAHSTAYGVEAYQAAWLKRYHPAEFLAAVLTHGKGFYDRLTYSIECRRLGIGFLHPDINTSSDRYTVTHAPDGKARIRPPLRQIKGLRVATLAQWKAGKPFVSMHDFAARVRPDSDELDALVRTGAFDGFGTSRTAQYWEARRILRAGSHPMPLFDPSPSFLPPPSDLRLERLRDEMELLGFTIGDHPLALFPGVAWETYCPIADLMQHAGRRVTIAGMIVADRSHHQVDGRPMKFLTLCDPTGLAECELFAPAYARFGAETIRHPVLEATAFVQPFENANGCTLHILSLRRARTRTRNRTTHSRTEPAPDSSSAAPIHV
jgi:error-prone DNA polymerase